MAGDAYVEAWMTVPEAAMLVHRAPRTVYEWIQHGKLSTRLNTQGAIVVSSKAVWLVEGSIRRGRPPGIPTRRDTD